MFEIGHILKTFYELYDDPIYNDAFLYSFGFNGYLDCLNGLKINLEERKVNVAVFLSKKERKSNKIKKTPPHIICGCTGRIYDMMRRDKITSKKIKLIILDEADEMLRFFLCLIVLEL